MPYMMEKTGLFLQVRLNSTRMPGKAVFNLCGKTLISHAMDRLGCVPADVKVVLTTRESVELLEPMVLSAGWEIFCGDRINVLKRYFDAAVKYEVDTIIRATGDNPLVSSEIALETLDLFRRKKCDLAHLKDIPYGSGVEIFTRDALTKAYANAVTVYEKEHVTPYIHENPDKFRIISDHFVQDEVTRPDVRVTVDTIRDFELVNAVVRDVASAGLSFRINNVIKSYDNVIKKVYRRMLIVIGTTDGSDKDNKDYYIRRALLLIRKFKDQFNIYYALRYQSQDYINSDPDDLLYKELSESAIQVDYSHILNTTENCCTYDRVVLDCGSVPVSEIVSIKYRGPVISFNDDGEGVRMSDYAITTINEDDHQSGKYNAYINLNIADDTIDTGLLATHGISDNKNMERVFSIIDSMESKSRICPHCSCDVPLLVYRNPKWNAYNCKRCGLIYTVSFGDNTKNYDSDYFLTEYKNQYGRTYEEDRPVIVGFANRRLKVIKEYHPGKKLLDFGSGLGFFAQTASEEGFETTSVDISDYCVEYIRDKLKLNAVKSDHTFFDRCREKYDVITGFYVIEHLHDYEKFIFGVYSSLNIRGVVALSTPNGSGITARKGLKEYFKKHPEDHYRFFTVRFLKNLLRDTGFKKIKIVTTGIHPERFVKSERLLSNRIFVYLLKKFAYLFNLGDTFEIYAQKN